MKDALPIEVPPDQIESLCRRRRVSEFALFGPVLRKDFGPDSDVDVLVTFEDDAPWSLYDLMDMKQELAGMFGRNVDLVEKPAIRNPFRRHEILRSHRVIYAA